MEQTRKGFMKLSAKPIGVKMKLNETEEGLDVFLHPLTREEYEDIEAIGVEGYIHFKEIGGDEKVANYRGIRQGQRQQVFFCVRTTDKDDSPRLFNDEREVMQIDQKEIERLISLYDEAFVPTRAEIKNSLRERLGLGSETESTSPNTSETQA